MVMSILLSRLQAPVRLVLYTGLTGLQSECPDYAQDLSLGRFRTCFWLPTGVDLPTLYI
jgi:hypothetical protein